MEKTLMGLVVLAVSGCAAAPPPSSEDTRKATAIVWFGSYTAPWNWEPPTIEILDHKCLSVEETDSFSYVGCVDGFFHEKTNRITIGWWTDSIHRSSLAHELWHAHEWKMHKDGDGNHLGRGWSTVVPEAEHDLAEEGL